MRHHEVGGLPDVVGPQAAVVLQPRLVGHQDRVRRLVELVAACVGRLLAVDEGVTWEAAVGQLLALEEEAHGGACGAQVAGRHQTGERLVEVAREHLAVGAEVDGLAIRGGASADRLPPRAGEGGDHGAGEGLVRADRDRTLKRAMTIAPASAPTAGAARRSPRPVGPTSRMSFAKTGRSATAPPRSTAKRSSEIAPSRTFVRRMRRTPAITSSRPSAPSAAGTRPLRSASAQASANSESPMEIE